MVRWPGLSGYPAKNGKEKSNLCHQLSFGCKLQYRPEWEPSEKAQALEKFQELEG